MRLLGFAAFEIFEVTEIADIIFAVAIIVDVEC